ncbi:MAG: HAD-IIB family hydrolase [Thermoplasmata archaeon]|nr:HAD-IIB family hydrolase [Thermoplasmata archaeon]
MEKIIIFTDMDGTFLEKETYSYKAAEPGLALIREHQIPLVFCTSKTKAEIEYYRNRLGLNEPFISENGGAIFIPKDYFEFEFEYDKVNDYFIIELGKPYQELREALEKIKTRVDAEIIGFGDMTVTDIHEDCGLTVDMAALSKLKDYDEAFKINGTQPQIDEVLERIKELGYNYSIGTRYYHIMGDSNKGKAVQKLIELYANKFAKIKTIGLGDGWNDLPMLNVVDIPVLVQKQRGKYVDLTDLTDNQQQEIGIDALSTDFFAKLYKAEGVGPEGWSKAIQALIRD